MILKKRYNIEIITQSSELLESSLQVESNTVYLSKSLTENGFKFNSNSNRVSSNFSWKGRSSKYIIEDNDYLLYQSKGKSSSKLFIELLENPKYLDNFRLFVERYFKFLVPVIDNKILTSFDKYSHILIKRKGDSIVTSKDISFDSIEEDELFAAIDPIKPYYETLNNEVSFSNKEILFLNNGFYKFYPKKVRNKNNFEFGDFFIQLESENLLEISSNYKVKYNDNILYNFINYPTNNVKIVLEDIYSPLISRKNLKENTKYIIYKLENNEYIPQFIISDEGKDLDENSKLLLDSHEEFLRPYFILPNKTIVSIKTKDDDVKMHTLFNSTFEDKIEELSKTIPHINFNI